MSLSKIQVEITKNENITQIIQIDMKKDDIAKELNGFTFIRGIGNLYAYDNNINFYERKYIHNKINHILNTVESRDTWDEPFGVKVISCSTLMTKSMSSGLQSAVSSLVKINEATIEILDGVKEAENIINQSFLNTKNQVLNINNFWEVFYKSVSESDKFCTIYKIMKKATKTDMNNCIYIEVICIKYFLRVDAFRLLFIPWAKSLKTNDLKYLLISVDLPNSNL